MEKKLITVKEMAENLGIGLNKAYDLVHAKGFPCIRLGKKILVVSDKVNDFIDSNIGRTF